MLRTIKRFWWLVLLAVGVPTAWGYALIGPDQQYTPLPVGFGDSWQTVILGYNGQRTIDALTTGPKNIGEGYRQNRGAIYYAYDATFLGFFGSASNGVEPADDAFAIMNAVFTNNPTGLANGLDGYSSSLSEFPLNSQHVNYQAYGLGLTDMKSITLWALVEQMGLAWPERYVWDLHQAYTPPAPDTCPEDTEYEVVMRNFPVETTLLDNALYSPYVNDVLYTFGILYWPNCVIPAGYDWQFFAQSVPVDPFADAWTSVAGSGQLLTSGEAVNPSPGAFYTGLTRDDVAGLRYLYSRNNIATESTATGALLRGTNNLGPQIITTQPFSVLAQALTNDPATLAAQFPGLLVSTVTNIYVTNGNFVTAYYTNYPGPTTTNLGTPGFLNPPPNSIVPPPGQTAWSGTMDFGLFYQQALTNTTGTTYDPATAVAQLVALYPGLVVVGTPVGYPTNVITTNFVTFLSVPPGSAYGNTNVSTVTVINGIYTNYEIRYSYNFGNVMLRSNAQFYPLTDPIPFVSPRSSTSVWGTNQTVSTTTVAVGIPIGAPYGNGVVTNSASSSFRQYGITGDFFLEPTNWCGFSAQLLIPTVLTSYTNVVVTSGTTNTQTGTATSTTTFTTLYTYTNGQFWVSPGVCEPVLQFSTNLISAVVTNYQNTLLNIYTNYYAPISKVIIITTNIYTTNGVSVGMLVTNVTTATNVVNVPTGDYFIIPAAWCGFTVQATLLTNVVFTTNTTVTTSSLLSSNGVTSTAQQLYSQTVISVYTNHNLQVQPWTCTLTAEGARLREGIQKIQFIRANYDSYLGQFFQPITNYYTMVVVTNSQEVPETFQRVVTQPDILLAANDEPLTSALPFYGSFGRSISFDTANVLTDLAGPGTINSPVTFSYNKAGNLYLNGSLASYGLVTNSLSLGLNSTTLSLFLNELTQSPLGVVWASYDASTNDPVVYPNGTSLQNLVNQMFVQVTPTPGILPDGTNGAPYSPITFTASGGAFTPPFAWGVAPGSLALPQGLGIATVNSVGTFSGTPANNAAGTFDFTIQLTDSVGRSVNWNYTITIH